MESNSIHTALSFDDVLIKPAQSSVLPNEATTLTNITKNIKLAIPLISSAMDTVTEYKVAISMAQSGGLGIIHKNMSIQEQADQVKWVKRYETGMVVNPVTISPDKTLLDALNLMKAFIKFKASNNVLSGEIVTGFTTMPVSYRFTHLT